MNVQVRVVCSANGHFIKQGSGHYEYEGGDTRLVGISSASSLQSLKEALNRVVSKGGGSASASGSPEVIEAQVHCAQTRVGLARLARAAVRVPPLLSSGLGLTLQEPHGFTAWHAQHGQTVCSLLARAPHAE